MCIVYLYHKHQTSVCVDILNISMFEFSTEFGNCSDLSSVLFCDHKHVRPCMYKHVLDHRSFIRHSCKWNFNSRLVIYHYCCLLMSLLLLLLLQSGISSVLVVKLVILRYIQCSDVLLFGQQSITLKAQFWIDTING